MKLDFAKFLLLLILIFPPLSNAAVEFTNPGPGPG